MSGRHLYNRLAASFAPSELEWRVQSSGMKGDQPWAKVLCYIDARAARRRLNEVMGPENWRVSYGNGPDNGVVATLALRINGEWIEKQDGAGLTDVEATKGGISDAFKRVCAVWGIGEYLYDAGESWAVFKPNGTYSSEIFPTKEDAKNRRNGKYHKWDGPVLQVGFKPITEDQAAPPAPPALPAGVTKGPSGIAAELEALRNTFDARLTDEHLHPDERDDFAAKWDAKVTTVKMAQKALKAVEDLISERASALDAMYSEQANAEREGGE